MMRSPVLVLLVSACAVFAVSTDLGGVVPSGATAYVPAEPNGFLDILYETKEFDSSFINGYATSPSYGWVTVDDIVLEDDSNIEKITYWVIRYQTESGVYHRFWELSGEKPGTELDNATVTATLTSTGQYAFGYLVYKMEAEMEYDIDSGHYFAGSYFSSGFWYMMVFENAYDYLCCFDYGGGGSGPWYTSQEMWGQSADFFQIIEGSTGPG